MKLLDLVLFWSFILTTSDGQLVSIAEWTASYLTTTPEEPPYLSLKNITEDIEMRLYPSQYFICIGEYLTPWKRDQERVLDMQAKLEGYFGGKNQLGKKMSLTLPLVHMKVEHRNGDLYYYQLCQYVPKEYQTMEPLPPLPLLPKQPSNFKTFAPPVLIKRPPITIYSKGYSGYSSPEKVKEELASLSASLREKGFRYSGERDGLRAPHFTNVYDPPGKFWSRKNEVWLLSP